MAIAILIFLAGFFGGTTTVLIYCVLREQLFTQKFDSERMKWANKAVIRDGAMPLFSAEDISGEGSDNVSPESTPTRIFEAATPFRRKQKQMREHLTDQHKKDIGANLPDVLKDKIAQAAEDARNAA